MIPLSVLALVLGLILPSLGLVYLSIFCSVVWIPLLIVGVVRLSASRRTG